MTIVSLSVPWQFGLPVLAGCHLMLWFIATGLKPLLGTRWCPDTIAIWVMSHACLMMVCWMAQSGVWSICGAMLFCVFIFRLSLVDQLTGLLPRDMTVSCLASGLLYAAGIGAGALAGHSFAALLIWCVLFAWRRVGYFRNGREMLGLGDVWIGSAMGAWLGFQSALYAIAAGTSAFLVWLFLSHREGGPMGPWLGGSALAAMILSLYKPEFVW